LAQIDRPKNQVQTGPIIQAWWSLFFSTLHRYSLPKSNSGAPDFTFQYGGKSMKRSTHRILTTHTGSLPRPSDLVDMVLRKEAKQPVDEEALAMRVRSAVAEVVLKQTEVGITFPNDGEQGKPGYSTYMKDRLTGFEAESTAAAV
jgi:hypothetical protein